MIDLGDELAGYGDDYQPPGRHPYAQPEPTPIPGGGSTIPLADLQAAGFNHTAPRGSPPWQSDMLKMLLADDVPLFGPPTEPPDCLKAEPPAPAGYTTQPGNLAIGIEPLYLGDHDVDVDLSAWGGRPPTSIQRPPGPVQDWLKMHTDDDGDDA